MRRFYKFLLLLAFTSPTLAGVPSDELERDRADCSSFSESKAIDACTRLLQQADVTADARAEILLNRAMAYQKVNSHVRALDDFSKSLSLKPDDVRAFALRSASRIEVGDLQGALRDSNEAFARDREHIGALVSRYIIALALGMTNSAIEDATAGVRFFPEYKRLPLALRAVAKTRAKDFEGAQSDLDEALKAGSASNGSRAAITALRAYVFAKQGLFAKSNEALAIARAADQKNEIVALFQNEIQRLSGRKDDRDEFEAIVGRIDRNFLTAARLIRAADPLQPHLASTPDKAVRLQRRVALVIGNGAYRDPKFVSLPNPPNDARDLAQALKQLGFEVTLAINADKATMEDKLYTFAEAARTSDVALAFYAGHGVQDSGINFLAPVDAKLDVETDLRRRFVRVQSFLEELQHSPGIRILVLDACRDNEAVLQLTQQAPASRGGSPTRGLSREKADGLLIAFATQPGRVAADGDGPNSPFTGALLNRLQTSGQDDVRVLFTKVRSDVLKATHGTQRPEVSDSLDGEFAFK